MTRISGGSKEGGGKEALPQTTCPRPGGDVFGFPKLGDSPKSGVSNFHLSKESGVLPSLDH